MDTGESDGTRVHGFIENSLQSRPLTPQLSPCRRFVIRITREREASTRRAVIGFCRCQAARSAQHLDIRVYLLAHSAAWKSTRHEAATAPPRHDSLRPCGHSRALHRPSRSRARDLAHRALLCCAACLGLDVAGALLSCWPALPELPDHVLQTSLRVIVLAVLQPPLQIRLAL